MFSVVYCELISVTVEPHVIYSNYFKFRIPLICREKDMDVGTWEEIII